MSYSSISLVEGGLNIVPEIGEVKRPSPQLGIKSSRVWLECPQCKGCRWVLLKDTHQGNFTGLCITCNRKQSRPREYKPYKYKDGRIPCGKSGYYKLKLQSDDFFYSMTDHDGYVLEHRLVIAKSLGRNLHRWEVIHHKGTKYPKGSKENKGDNRRENLQLVSDERHTQITIMEERIKYLERLLIKAGISFNGEARSKTALALCKVRLGGIKV